MQLGGNQMRAIACAIIGIGFLIASLLDKSPRNEEDAKTEKVIISTSLIFSLIFIIFGL